MTAVKRHPSVPLRRFPLDEPLREFRIRAGQFVTDRGEPFAIPSLPMGEWVRHPGGEITRPGVQFERQLYSREDLPPHLQPIYDSLGKDNLKLLYRASTGHDMHFSIQGNLYARHFHAGWANPLTGEVEEPLDPDFSTFIRTHWEHVVCDMGTQCPAIIWPSAEAALTALRSVRGWTEDLGWLSGGLVTDAFVSEIVDELTDASGSEFADFDFHEVGTDDTAESNDHTGLQVSSGIARETGTPTDSDPDYVNVATITADASETWEEHGLFNNSSGAAMMDRSLTGGQAVVSSDQVEYTYTLTCNPET